MNIISQKWVTRLFNISRTHSKIISINFSDDSSDHVDKNEKNLSKKSNKEDKKEQATKRLNELLANMTTDTNVNIIQSVAVARGGFRKQKPAKQDLSEKPTNIIEAAKQVATEIGGDTKQTESELLSKLLNYTNRTLSTKIEEQENNNAEELNLSDVIAGMKVDRLKPEHSHEKSRSDYIRKTVAKREYFSSSEKPHFQSRSPKNVRDPHEIQEAKMTFKSVDLFGAKPLGIFTNIEFKEDLHILKTWRLLQERELKLAVTHPPANYFQKMALWTEEGKLWKFPIDNEQGMDEEGNISFTEHIFLEEHLESWCPSKGPIRHFMELVCVGLSKNPYLTVTEKKEHIDWFRIYFDEKKDILEKVIVLDETPKAAKSIEP